jgi:hypothetical protein
MSPAALPATAALESLGLPGRDAYDLPTSAKRFADGAAYRVEIPSVEGPEAFRAVVDEAELLKVPVRRISQGSGIMMLRDEEIVEMVGLGREQDVEVCLFVGPRASWDVGVQALTKGGAIGAAALRGADQLAYGLEDVLHAIDLGLRSVLVADLGLLAVLGRLRASGGVPEDLIVKVSASLPVTNPATARVLEDLGATTLNVAGDLSLPALAAIRAAVDCPFDLFVEGPDDFGGSVRHYEVPEMVRVCAPIHLKFAVRNSPGIYPSGRHLQQVALDTARERVRRASIGLAMLERYPLAEG